MELRVRMLFSRVVVPRASNPQKSRALCQQPRYCRSSIKMGMQERFWETPCECEFGEFLDASIYNEGNTSHA